MSADQLTQLTVWTIYERPADYPQGFVVRPFEITSFGPQPGSARYASDLEAARRLVPPGLYCLPRQAGDDPVVVESWI